MDEEMEEFIVDCLDVCEIDSEYEFDAAHFFDFCRPESTSDAEEVERWFLTSGNYPPSPLIIKLNLGKEATSGTSKGCSKLQEVKTAKSKCNNSYVPVSSEVSPSKSKTKGTISNGRITPDFCKTKPETRSSNARCSTLMKPTASHLAKQKCQIASNKSDVTSSQNSLASEIIATKRQKLEIGYLLKIAHLKHQRLLSHKTSKTDVSAISNSSPKSKVTVPREPELETLQRAQRRNFRCSKDSESSEITKAKTQMVKARSLNKNAPALPHLRKTRAPLPEYHLSHSPNADSATHNALVDFKRSNIQSSTKQGKSLNLLKSRSHKCNKIFPSREDDVIGEDTGQESTNSMESRFKNDEKLSVRPPIELFNKLSLRSDKEKGEVPQPKKNPSAKELKENTPDGLQLKPRKCVGKLTQCAAERGDPRIGHHSSMNRSLGIR